MVIIMFGNKNLRKENEELKKENEELKKQIASLLEYHREAVNQLKFQLRNSENFYGDYHELQ